MPKYLETTADKFTFRVATDRLYTAEGVWVLPEADGKRVRVGLVDYLQQHNGDVAFAEPTAWDAERPKLLGPAAHFAVTQVQVQEDLKGL